MFCSIRRFLCNFLLYFFVSTIALVLLFKAVPIPFTPLMLLRHIEAKQEGRNLELHHEWVPLEDISPKLIAAVVNNEDAHFYDHHGFDFNAIRYAHELNKRHGCIMGGGSSISQQTAKNIFTFHSRTYFRKAIETYFTVLIEFFWSKDRIIEVYLNIIEMGDGVFGAEAAADYHFSCPAYCLDTDQSNYIAWRLPDPRR